MPVNSLLPVALLFISLVSLAAPAEQVLSQKDGNFILEGRLRLARGETGAIHFRLQSGLGYRIRLGGPASGVLDDPGRRDGVLARPLEVPDFTGGTRFRLHADGAKIVLEWNGKTAWQYTEREAAVPSAGQLLFRSAGGARLTAVTLTPKPPTPPSFAERFGPALGATAPAIRAVDQNGALRDFASLAGPKGLWILFIRSADW